MVELVPAEAFKVWQSKGAVLLDVRSEAEYKEKHVRESINLPLDQLAGNISKIPHDKPVLVICRSGRRSFAAVSFLEQQDFDNVFNICGGILAWQQLETNFLM